MIRVEAFTRLSYILWPSSTHNDTCYNLNASSLQFTMLAWRTDNKNEDFFENHMPVICQLFNKKLKKFNFNWIDYWRHTYSYSNSIWIECDWKLKIKLTIKLMKMVCKLGGENIFFFFWPNQIKKSIERLDLT